MAHGSPGRVCPTHRVRLDGGPVWFRCPAGHALVAADVYREFGEAVAS